MLVVFRTTHFKNITASDFFFRQDILNDKKTLENTLMNIHEDFYSIKRGRNKKIDMYIEVSATYGGKNYEKNMNFFFLGKFRKNNI